MISMFYDISQEYSLYKKYVQNTSYSWIFNEAEKYV
jgi:hypothetical protein